MSARTALMIIASLIVVSVLSFGSTWFGIAPTEGAAVTRQTCEGSTGLAGNCQSGSMIHVSGSHCGADCGVYPPTISEPAMLASATRHSPAPARPLPQQAASRFLRPPIA